MPVMRQGCLSLAGLINPTFSWRIIGGRGAAGPSSRAGGAGGAEVSARPPSAGARLALPPAPSSPPLPSRPAPPARLQFITLGSRVEWKLPVWTYLSSRRYQENTPPTILCYKGLRQMTLFMARDKGNAALCSHIFTILAEGGAWWGRGIVLSALERRRLLEMRL